MLNEDCIFCKIIKGEIPSKKVFEDEKVLAFLDIFPTSPGHTIIIPKKHYYNILDFPDEELGGFFQNIKKIAGILKEKLYVDGFNIVQNNFPAAGQVVPHAHYHIIPRKESDNVISIKSSKSKASDQELDAIINKIKGK